MATSSIFTSFSINDSKIAESFIKALNRSSEDPERVSSSSPKYITDKDKIKAFFTNKKGQ